MSELEGKRIGIALSPTLLHNNRILGEAEKIMSMGGELWLLLLEEAVFSPGAKHPFLIDIEKKLLNLMAIKCQKENATVSPGLDLLAIVPSPSPFLQKIIKAKLNSSPSYPLLLAPEGGLELLPALSRLIFKKEVYLVPCGTLPSSKVNNDKKITYRADLLAEACRAAFNKRQLEPLFWENASFPG